MPLEDEKVRSFVKNLLEEKKSLTEKDVKAAIAKNFKVSPKEVGAGLIREVRKAMGIDRPTALAYAKALLKKDPLTEGKAIVEAIAEKFGVRLGPPDVSRLRPKKAKDARPRGRGASKAAKARAAKAEKAGPPARRAGRRTAKPAALKASGSAVRRGAKKPPGGIITLAFEGSGHPADLAEFFLSLGKEA